MTSTEGAIVDGGDTGGADVIAGGRLVVDAVTGVGSGAAIETTVKSLDIDTITSGDITIDNNFAAGTVRLIKLSVASGNGIVNFTNTGNQALRIANVTTNNGNITITNNGDANTDAITINTPVVTSGTNTISITSLTRGDIVINTGISTAAGGTITLNSSDDINIQSEAIAINSGSGGAINLNVDTNNEITAILDLGGAVLNASTINFNGGGDASGLVQDKLIGTTLGNNTWTLATGSDNGTLVSTTNITTAASATFTDFHNLTGNANIDLFDFNGGNLSGNVDGQGGVNTLDYSTLDGPISVTLNATGGTTGFAGSSGSASQISGVFDDINTLIGSKGVDTLTGINAAAEWKIDGTNQYVSTNTLDFSAIENLSGNASIDTFTVTASHSGILNGQANNDAFNLSGSSVVSGNLVGDAGNDTFDFDNIARVIGNVDGGVGIDTINFNGSTLGQKVTITDSGENGQTGTILDDPGQNTSPNTALITANFTDINLLSGNTISSLIGQNVNTFWNITGTNSGTYGASLELIAINVFNDFAIVTGGTAADTFVFQNNSTAKIVGGIDGGAGTNILAGSVGVDSFGITGSNIVVVTPSGGVSATNLTNITNIDGTSASDSGADVFTLNAGVNWAGSLNGTGGNDRFILNNTSTIGGTLTGGTGSDTLNLSAYSAARNVILNASSTGNGFAGTETSISGGFSEINVLTLRNAVDDSLQGANFTNTWVLSGSNSGSLTQNDNTLTYSGVDDFIGGTAADTFTLTGTQTGTILGNAGDDIFNLNTGGALTGTISGNADNDTFNLNSGTTTGAVAGGEGLDTLAGSTAYTINGTNSGTQTQLNGGWNTIENLTGTENAADTFTFAGGSISGTANGLGNNDGDRLNFGNAAAQTITITEALATNEFGGTSTSAANFININVITGSGNNDTFTSSTAGGTFTIQASNDTYFSNGQTLNFTAFENLAGNTGNDIFNINQARNVNINTAAGDNVVNVNQSLTGGITTGSGSDTVILNATVNGNVVGNGQNDFQINNTLTGNLTGSVGVDILNVNGTIIGAVDTGAGNDVMNLNGTITGDVTGGPGENVLNPTVSINGTYTPTGNDTWNHTSGVSLATRVTGTGSITIPGTEGQALNVGGGDLILPNLTGFQGHTVIGGTLTPSGVDPYFLATDITFNSSLLTVTNAIQSGGSVTLLGGDIILNNDITVSGQDSLIGMIAAGPLFGGDAGDIDASGGPVKLTAPPSNNNPSGALIAENTIVNSENITLSFGGLGEVDVAVGADADLEFNGASTNVDVSTDEAFEAFILGVLSDAGLTVGITTTFSINPASALIGLETLAFIDVGLFEEELTLYGQIGMGIALSLAQCEEQEGCVPSVTEDELNTLIESLKARVIELERRLAEATDSNVRSELGELIGGFNKELKDFRDYRQELQEFFASEDEDEDFDEDEGFDDEDFNEEDLYEDLPDGNGSLDRPIEMGEVERLAKVLETVKSRVEWLERLKVNPDERARLSELTKIELTQEVLDTIIEAAKSEAVFIENQIKLLIESTEAMFSPAPMFTAEVRDYDSMQTVHYGTDYLNSLPRHPLLNIN
ncbi:MAG: hypothetical protein CMF45_09070 [Legionellales bacterium]|nr:hypothetical protein [Legionellales bacterium]